MSDLPIRSISTNHNSCERKTTAIELQRHVLLPRNRIRQTLHPAAHHPNLPRCSAKSFVLAYASSDMGQHTFLRHRFLHRHIRVSSSAQDLEPGRSGEVLRQQVAVHHVGEL